MSRAMESGEAGSQTPVQWILYICRKFILARQSSNHINSKILRATEEIILTYV